MTPTLNGSHGLKHFECGNVVEICKWNNVRFLPGTATYAIVEALVDAVQ